MKFIKIIVLLAFSASTFAQQKDSIPNLTKQIIDGDTIYVASVDPVYIFSPIEFEDAQELLKYQKLVRNVKKAYPYAVLANVRFKAINDSLSKLKTKKEQKEYLDKAEKELTEEIKPIARKLTITQGRILMKLIDRETGNTAYSLVKELKGSFSAIFYQSFARLFGSNLKSKYDPKGEDRDIEDIIQKIQRGQI